MHLRSLTATAVMAVVVVTACSAPSSSTATSPPAPTAGTTLAVQSRGAIRVVDTVSGQSTALASTAPKQEQPDWSPDGTRVVFESAFNSIWVETLATGEARSIFDCAAPCGAVQDPAWSPDGRQVVFMLSETDGTTTTRSMLEAIDVETGDRRTLYADTSGTVWTFAPRWSPDGVSVVFEETTWASDSWTEEAVAHVRVMVVRADGSTAPRSLVEWTPLHGAQPASPDWSPAGDLIVYSKDGNLHAIAPDGNDDRAVTEYDDVREHAIQPTFSPDGKSIVFTYVTGVFGTSDQASAAQIGVDGTAFTVLVSDATHPRIRPAQA